MWMPFFTVQSMRARASRPVADQFWGDRYGILTDPFGHRWSIASRIEDLSPKALQERAASWATEQEHT
jgi:PhnB protein